MATSDDSILTDVKKTLGISDEYTHFDLDVVLHINSAFLTLQQLGVGPTDGFAITGAAETWASFIGSEKGLNAVKSYVYLRVRLLFDPPSTSFALESFGSQLKELEWRLMVLVDPDPNRL